MDEIAPDLSLLLDGLLDDSAFGVTAEDGGELSGEESEEWVAAILPFSSRVFSGWLDCLVRSGEDFDRGSSGEESEHAAAAILP